MADVSVNVLTPATSFSLVTLAELKVALGGATGTAATDAQYQWLIDANSETVSDICTRVFAKERVVETWRDLVDRRVFLTHFPVKADDIESVTTAGLTQVGYELEEESGKLSLFASQSEPIIITYTGGYELPDEAPLPLRQATVLLSATWKAQLAMVQVTGVRMIAHKEARVMFHTPTALASGAKGYPPAVDAILSAYTRYWI